MLTLVLQELEYSKIFLQKFLNCGELKDLIKKLISKLHKTNIALYSHLMDTNGFGLSNEQILCKRLQAGDAQNYKSYFKL